MGTGYQMRKGKKKIGGLDGKMYGLESSSQREERYRGYHVRHRGSQHGVDKTEYRHMSLRWSDCRNQTHPGLISQDRDLVPRDIEWTRGLSVEIMLIIMVVSIIMMLLVTMRVVLLVVVVASVICSIIIYLVYRV